MELPPSIPARLSNEPWLCESYRDDLLLVSDAALIDVEPYRPRSLEWATAHLAAWNRADARRHPLLHEFNWFQATPDPAWRRCYGVPTDGTHRAAAARDAGVAVWITVRAYFFEREAVYLHGLPPDRLDFAPWLVPVGTPPRPLYEVRDLPMHRPRDLLAASKPDQDGLIGFGGEGGVVRVRLYARNDRRVVLFSPAPNALGGPSPTGTVHGQADAMRAIWSALLVGDERHPKDVEWWAHPGGGGSRWYDPTGEVTVVPDPHGGFEFRASPRRDEEPPPPGRAP